MKIITVFLGAILTMGLAGVAQAKLGETIEQIEARYGKALTTIQSAGATINVYSVGGNKVEVRFLNAKAEMETVKLNGEKMKISDELCMMFAETMTGRTDWKKGKSGLTLTSWTSSTNFMAMRESKPLGSDVFQVMSTAWADHESAIKKMSIKALADEFGASVKANPRP
jgi:hypothetical protein